MKKSLLVARMREIREQNEFYEPVLDNLLDTPLGQLLLDLDTLVDVGYSLVRQCEPLLINPVINAMERGIIDLYKRREFGYAFCYFGIYQGLVPKLEALRKVA